MEDSVEVVQKPQGKKIEVILSNKRKTPDNSFPPELKSQSMVRVSVRKEDKIRGVGDFTLKTFPSEKRTEAYINRLQYLRDNGFPVPNTVKRLEGHNQVLVTDLSEKGTKRVLFMDIGEFAEFQTSNEILNLEEVKDILVAIAQKADSLGIIVEVYGCNLVVDQNRHAEVVIPGDFAVAVTKEEKENSFFESSVESVEKFLLLVEEERQEQKEEQLRREQLERWQQEEKAGVQREQQARRYLTRHLEPTHPDETTKLTRDVFFTTPPTEIRSDSPEGVEVVFDGLKVGFTFQPVDTSGLTPEQLGDLEKNGGVSSNREIIGFRIVDLLDPSIVLTLDDILPKGARAFFWQVGVSPENPGNGFAKVGERTVYVSGDLTNLDGTVTFLHEVGHLMEDPTQTESNKTAYTDLLNSWGGPPTLESGQRILESERNAWVYAFKKLKLFLNRNRTVVTRESTLATIHGYFLNRYSERIRRHLERQLQGL